MNSVTQIKIFQHEDASNVNNRCNTWLIENKSKLGLAKIEFKYSGEFNSTAGYLCSVMLIISNLNSANKKWDWANDFELETCI